MRTRPQPSAQTIETCKQTYILIEELIGSFSTDERIRFWLAGLIFEMLSQNSYAETLMSPDGKEEFSIIRTKSGSLQ